MGLTGFNLQRRLALAKEKAVSPSEQKKDLPANDTEKDVKPTETVETQKPHAVGKVRGTENVSNSRKKDESRTRSEENS